MFKKLIKQLLKQTMHSSSDYKKKHYYHKASSSDYKKKHYHNPHHSHGHHHYKHKKSLSSFFSS